MVKRLAILAMLFGVFTAGRSCTLPNGSVVVFAQSLPATINVSINPNAASENVVDYQFSLDGGAPVTVLASACTATACSTSFSVSTFGNHLWSAVARNQKISCTDGTCTPPVIQAGPAATQHFALNQAPSLPTGQAVK
jgi:hypothetical protein